MSLDVIWLKIIHRYLQQNHVSRTTRTNAASHVQSASSVQDADDILPAGRAPSVSAPRSNPSSGYNGSADHYGEVLYTPLTTEALREHDFQLETFSPLSDFMHNTQQRYVTGLGATIAALCDERAEDLMGENITHFDDMTRFDNSARPFVFNYTLEQLQQGNLGNNINGTAYETPPCHSTASRYPDSAYQDESTYMVERDGNEIDCEQVDLDQELTARRNDLAGIRAHLSEYNYSEEPDDFAVE